MKINKLKIPGIILVRTNSKRLPEKCFLNFGKYSVLHHVVQRCLHYNINPIICTTTLSSDDKIVKLAKMLNIPFYRGSSNNKILRISNCCKKFKLDFFHTIDADDPFFCGAEVRRSIGELVNKRFDIIEPTVISSKGSGLVGYSAKSIVFHNIVKKISSNKNTEMMWGFFKKAKNIKIKKLSQSKFDIKSRLTLDYYEDYILLQSIRLILGNFASRKDIVKILKKNADLLKVNMFRNKEWSDNQKKHLQNQND